MGDGGRSAVPCPPSTPNERGRRSGTAVAVLRSRASVTSGLGRTMLSKPLACPSTLDRPIGVLRGGELEPGAPDCFEKSQAKAAGNSAANSACAKRRRTFLSEAGPRSGTGLSQAGHHSLTFDGYQGENDEGDPFGSPSLWLAMRLET